MYSDRSHGRLFWILLMVAVPAWVGFGIGMCLSKKIYQSQQIAEKKDQSQYLVSQAQLLTEMIRSEVEVIQTQAFAQIQSANSTPNSPSVLIGSILHLAEFKTQGDSLTAIKRSLRNSSWAASSVLEEFYLKSAVQTIKLSELQKNGMSVLRLRKDSRSAQEWLSFAFLNEGSKDRPEERTVILALIEPSTVFQSIQKWISYSAGGRLRSYLVGKDGRILLHSLKNWTAGNMSQIPLFKDQIYKVISGAWVSGTSEALAIDQVRVRAAYYRLGNLPLSVVVEEVQSDRSLQLDFYLVSFGLFLLTLLSVFIFSSAWGLKKFLTQKIWVPVYTDVPEVSPGPIHSDLALEMQDPQRFFSEDDLLVLSPGEGPRPGKGG